MTSDLLIRDLDPSDTEAVVAIAVAAWEPIYDYYRETMGDDLFLAQTPNWQESKGSQVRAACQPGSPTFVSVVERGGEVVGFITYLTSEETGIGTVEVANRMADYGVDPWWMSHEPWVVPEPFTPEAGEMYGKEDLDYWLAVVAQIAEEARRDPDMVKSAPHRQPIAQIDGSGLDDPERWAMTWRAWRRKQAARQRQAAAAE